MADRDGGDNPGDKDSPAREFMRAVVNPEVERKCSKCGEIWQVPSHYVHRDTDVSARGQVLRPEWTAKEVATFNEAARGFDTCPGCGAYRTFRQHHLFLETRDEDVREKE